MVISKDHKGIADGLYDKFEPWESDSLHKRKIRFINFTDVPTVSKIENLVIIQLKGLRERKITKRKRVALLRDILIHCGSLCGFSERELAQVTGLAHSRIHTILKQWPRLNERTIEEDRDSFS